MQLQELNKSPVANKNELEKIIAGMARTFGTVEAVIDPDVAPVQPDVFRDERKAENTKAIETSLRGMTPEEVIADYVSQTPLGRIETAEDVADVAIFLASNSARFMTGQGVNVTGGVYMT